MELSCEKLRQLCGKLLLLLRLPAVLGETVELKMKAEELKVRAEELNQQTMEFSYEKLSHLRRKLYGETSLL